MARRKGRVSLIEEEGNERFRMKKANRYYDVGRDARKGVTMTRWIHI